jgi:hypothetical protein
MTVYPDKDTSFPDSNPLKRSIIEKRFSSDKTEFAHDVSTHVIELCDACRRGDLEAVQTYFRDCIDIALSRILRLILIGVMRSMRLR